MGKAVTGSATLLAWLIVLAAWDGPALCAADPKDFSGTWKLDTARSDFGQFPGPAELTDRIVQNGSELLINRNRGGERVVIHVPLDGSQRDNKLALGAVKTRAHWEAATLVIDYTGQRRGSTVKSEERWTLGPKKTTLRVIRHLSAAKGEMQQTLTMVKVDAGTH